MLLNLGGVVKATEREPILVMAVSALGAGKVMETWDLTWFLSFISSLFLSSP